MSYEQVCRIMAGGLHRAVCPLPDQRSPLHSASRLLSATDAGTSTETPTNGIYGHTEERGAGCAAHSFCLGTDAACEAEIDKVKASHKGAWA